jgi:hypothetical protein
VYDRVLVIFKIQVNSAGLTLKLVMGIIKREKILKISSSFRFSGESVC